MERSITVTIGKNDYQVNYPNVGNQIDIEILKSKIADGNYDMLRFSNNPLFQEQADRIYMIAVFTILIPELKKDLNVKSFFDLKEEESAELMRVYNRDFIPWFIEIKKQIRESLKEKEEALRDKAIERE